MNISNIISLILINDYNDNIINLLYCFIFTLFNIFCNITILLCFRKAWVFSKEGA